MRCTLLTRQGMGLAVNIMHGHGLTNKIFPGYNQGKVVLVVNIAAKDVIHPVHY